MTRCLVQVPTTDEKTFMGYGPVVSGGYGCSYNLHEKQILFCISSWRSCRQTSTKLFSKNLDEGLLEMKDLLENASRWSCSSWCLLFILGLCTLRKRLNNSWCFCGTGVACWGCYKFYLLLQSTICFLVREKKIYFIACTANLPVFYLFRTLNQIFFRAMYTSRTVWSRFELLFRCKLYKFRLTRDSRARNSKSDQPEIIINFSKAKMLFLEK